MRKRILGTLLMLCTMLGWSQQKYSLSGTVTDSESGETLFDAQVFLEGTDYETTTNDYGFYSITAQEGEYTLVVYYEGNEITKDVLLNENMKLDLEMTTESIALEETVITSNRDEQTNIKSPQMGVTKLRSETIKKIPAVLGEVDIIKAIQTLPGVTNNGEGSSGFNVRGGAVDQNLVLLDEAIVYNTSHLFGFFSVFNADAVKDIALYRGNIPAQYGGRVSSVLDVHQKEGNRKQFRLSGGVGVIASRAAIEAPILNKKGSFLLAGRYSTPFEIDGSSANFYDINLKTNYEIDDKNKIFLSGYYGRDNFKLANVVDNNYGNITGNLRWNHIFNDRLFSNLSLIYSNYDYQVILDFLKFDWKAGINNINLKYDLEYYLNDKMTLDFGVTGINYTLNPGEVEPTAPDSSFNPLELQKQNALETAIYANMEHKLTDKLTLSYGLRWSYFNRVGAYTEARYANGQPLVYNPTFNIYEEGEQIGEEVFSSGSSIRSFNNLEPRASLAFQLNNKSSVKLGYARTAQYLHLLSNTQSATPLDVWTPSGTFIEPQLSDQYAVGYFRTFKNKAYGLEVEAYYKTVDNRIDYINGAELVGNENIETEILTGEMRAYGLEVLLRKNRGRFNGWLAYTLSKAEQRTPGGIAGGLGINNGEWYNANHDRTHDFSVTANYELTKKWTFSANAIFQTGRPVTYPNGQFIYEGESFATYSKRNGDRLPAYHRLDLSATWKPNRKPEKRWKGEWVFSIYNVYNRRNAASITFGQNTITGLNEATRTAIFGIVPAVSYNFKF